MRYLKPHYYDKFECIADQCPDTCCAGWQIMIDDTSLEHYAKTDAPFGLRLRNSIDWEEGSFLQYNGRCSLLNEYNLCDLYLELGPDSLCDTCRMYPRHTEEYDGLRELSITLSCPAAAKIILGCQEKVRFEEFYTEEEDDFEEFDFLMFSQLEDAREVLFRILQNRNEDLRIRMAASYHLAKDFQTCMEEDRTFDIDEMLTEYDCKNNSGHLKDYLAAPHSALLYDGITHQTDTSIMYPISGDSSILFDRRLKELSLLKSLERLRPEWNEILHSAEKLLFKDGPDSYANILHEFHNSCGYNSPNKEQWSIFGEQLMIFFVYTYFCGSVYDDMVCTKMGIALFSTIWIQELAMMRWLENGRTLSFSDVLEITWRFAREVEHSDQNLDTLEEWLSDNL